MEEMCLDWNPDATTNQYPLKFPPLPSWMAWFTLAQIPTLLCTVTSPPPAGLLPPSGQFGPPCSPLHGHKTFLPYLVPEGLHLQSKRKHTWPLPEIMALFYDC